MSKFDKTYKQICESAPVGAQSASPGGAFGDYTHGEYSGSDARMPTGGIFIAKRIVGKPDMKYFKNQKLFKKFLKENEEWDAWTD